MDHTAISCPTKGGKSTFLREICKQFRRAGNDVLLYDPLGYSWPASFVTDDIYRLFSEAKRRRNCALLIDECGETPLDVDKSLKWLLTGSRHNGHVTYFAMQDYTQLALKMRKQLAQAYIFKCHPKEAEEWAFQFHQNRDFILRTAPNLKRYEFIKVGAFADPIGPVALKIN